MMLPLVGASEAPSHGVLMSSAMLGFSMREDAILSRLGEAVKLSKLGADTITCTMLLLLRLLFKAVLESADCCCCCCGNLCCCCCWGRC